MTTTKFNQEITKCQRLEMTIEPEILDELEEAKTKICAMLKKPSDFRTESLQPFVDNNSDYMNPLKLKDNSSLIRVFQHIEEAELLAEMNTNYIMQPLPTVERISWTLKPQIPIKTYEVSSTLDLEHHSLLLTQSRAANLVLPLVPCVSSKEKEFFNLLPPIQEETDKEFNFKDLSSAVNALGALSNSNIGAVAKNSQLENVVHEDKTEAVDFEHSNNNLLIGPNDSSIKDEIGLYDLGVTVGKGSEKLTNMPVNQPERDNSNDIWSENFPKKRENNEPCCPYETSIKNYTTDNSANESTNIKFQYARLTNENLEKERELTISDDCIILVCKECGFEEYI